MDKLRTFNAIRAVVHFWGGALSPSPPPDCMGGGPAPSQRREAKSGTPEAKEPQPHI